MMSMTFAQAAAFVMPFGKNAGLMLDTIAETDKGLLYLDWLYGQRNLYFKDGSITSRPAIDVALITYLGDKTIADALTNLVRK